MILSYDFYRFNNSLTILPKILYLLHIFDTYINIYLLPI